MSVDEASPVREDRLELSAYLRTALAPRMLSMLVLFLLAAAVCIRLGIWQIDRAQERGQLNAAHELAEQQNVAPSELGELLAPQVSFPGNLVGKRTRVTGEFDPDGQLFVEGRAHDGELGYLVLTPLRVTDDGSRGSSWANLSGSPVLPVVRGWVPSPGPYEPSTGPAEVNGFLQASESVELGMVGPNITDSISSGALANRWGGPIYSGYVVLAESDPSADPGIALLPRPTIDGGTGLDMTNLFYAIQWWTFAAFALALWVRLVRDETKVAKGEGFEGWEGLQPGA